MGSWHEAKLRVRFEETDMMGVVYYSKFLNWMEVGRISLLRDAGLPYSEWEAKKFHVPVVQAHADYKASAKFDDEIVVKTRVGLVGNTSIRFENEIYKSPEMSLLCTGHTVHALIDETGSPTRVPNDIRAILEGS
ncbi:MAG TPA: thioesterase family protein [Nitrososphaerales archaeon]|nr:thioesterase family protein [Nitrososphaerales archaeon]